MPLLLAFFQAGFSPPVWSLFDQTAFLALKGQFSHRCETKTAKHSFNPLSKFDTKNWTENYHSKRA